MTPIISLTRVAFGFASLALVAQAGAVNFQQSKDVVMLPANAMMAIEKNGKFAIISDTGRFIIQGTVFDVWQDKEIKTLDDARFAAQPGTVGGKEQLEVRWQVKSGWPAAQCRRRAQLQGWSP